MMKMNRKNRIEIRLSDVELNCLNKAVEKGNDQPVKKNRK